MGSIYICYLEFSLKEEFLYLFIHSIIYLCHYGIVHVYLFFNSYYHYSNCSSFSHWDLSQVNSCVSLTGDASSSSSLILPTILFLPPLPHPLNPLVFSSFFMALYDVLSSYSIFPAPDLESAIFPRNLHFFYCEMALGSFEVFGVCFFFLMFLLACNKFSKNTVIIIYMISSSIK